jgi:RNA polymerase sigma factor (sigma-70 family)
MFAWRGLNEAEDLADETINRVARKLQDLAPSYIGEPASYIYGVARKIMHEYSRLKSQPPLTPISNDIAAKQNTFNYEVEALHNALDKCLSKLTAADRELLRAYYEDYGATGIAHRKALAQKYNLSHAALRQRIHRLIVHLKKRIKEELARSDRSKVEREE